MKYVICTLLILISILSCKHFNEFSIPNLLTSDQSLSEIFVSNHSKTNFTDKNQFSVIVKMNVVSYSKIQNQIKKTNLNGRTRHFINSEVLFKQFHLKENSNIKINSIEQLLGNSIPRIKTKKNRVALQNIQRIFLIRFDNLTYIELSEIIRILYNWKIFDYVNENSQISLSEKNSTNYRPNDPLFPLEWYQRNIQSEQGWNYNFPNSTGNKNTIISVIDTGVDYNHVDLVENIWKNPGETGLDGSGNDKSKNGIDDDQNGFIDDVIGWDFYDDDNDPMDIDGHGTHVAGIAAGKGNNGVGITGVCPNCSILPLRVGTAEKISTSDAISALSYASQIGSKIFNCSWSTTNSEDALRDIINYVNSNNSSVITSAGNNTANLDKNPSYPESFREVITVAGTDKKNAMANFTNYGSTVDVSAPGVNILSTILNDQYGYKDGTSMATPIVSGMAGLILSLNQDLNPGQLENIIKECSTKFESSSNPPTDYIGTGVTSVTNSLNCMNQYKNFVATEIIYPFGQEIDDTINMQFYSEGTNYSISMGKGTYPSEWTILENKTNSSEDISFPFDSKSWDESVYTLKFQALNDLGYKGTQFSIIEINNIKFLNPKDNKEVSSNGDVNIQIYSNDSSAECIKIEYSLLGTSEWNTNGISCEKSVDNDHLIVGTLLINSINSKMGTYKIRATIKTNEIESVEEVTFHFTNTAPGFPVYLEGSIDRSHIMIEDIDANNSTKEIIIGTKDGSLYSINADGSIRNGWPVKLNGGIITPPAIGNFVDDEAMEIIQCTDSGYCYIINSSSKILMNVQLNIGYQSAPTLADLDFDGDLEIAIGGEYLYIIENNFEIISKEIITSGGISYPISISNLDSDEFPELVATYGFRTMFNLNIWNYKNGEIVDYKNGYWPIEFNEQFNSSAPIIADFDQNGTSEIFIGASNTGNIYSFNPDGSTYMDPIQTEENLAFFLPTNMDDDQTLEIVFSSYFGNLKLINGDTKVIEQNINTNFGNIAVDISGIGRRNLFTLHCQEDTFKGTIGFIQSVDKNGKNFNFSSQVIGCPYSYPGIHDLNLDGILDLAVSTSDGAIYLWSISNSKTEYLNLNFDWPMALHDSKHSGSYNNP